MAVRQAVILWVSGALTAFVLLGIVWTALRNDLDASRHLVQVAERTLERTEQLLQEVGASDELRRETRVLNETGERLLEDMRATREGITQAMEELVELMYGINAATGAQQVQFARTEALLQGDLEGTREAFGERVEQLAELFREFRVAAELQESERRRAHEALLGEVEALAEQVRLLRERVGGAAPLAASRDAQGG